MRFRVTVRYSSARERGNGESLFFFCLWSPVFHFEFRASSKKHPTIMIPGELRKVTHVHMLQLDTIKKRKDHFKQLLYVSSSTPCMTQVYKCLEP